MRHRSDAPGVDGNGSGAESPKSRKPKVRVDAAMAALPAGLVASLNSYALAGMPGVRRVAAIGIVALSAVVGG
jgi:hypothetical protein